MDHLTIDQLQSDDAKRLFKHMQSEILRLEHRIAFQNKVAAHSMLKTHEQAVFEERLGAA